MASSDNNDPRANQANQAQRNETNEVQNGAQRAQFEDTTSAAYRAWRNRVEDRAREILTRVAALERANAEPEDIRAVLRASDVQYRRSNTARDHVDRSAQAAAMDRYVERMGEEYAESYRRQPVTE